MKFTSNKCFFFRVGGRTKTGIEPRFDWNENLMEKYVKRDLKNKDL